MFSLHEINELKDIGKDYVGDWIAWGNDLSNYEGISEAYDIAKSYIGDGKNNLTISDISAAADHVYEGMMSELQKIKLLGVKSYLTS